MHFTGKLRDTETNNDDFGARYFNSGMARWLTPDWSARPEGVPYATLANPQTLNLYAYVGNNPVTHTDPDGHFVSDHAETFFDEPIQVPAGGSYLDPESEAYHGTETQQANETYQQPKNEQEATLSNVIYNETSGLRSNPNAKPGEAGSAEDLHNGRVAVGEIANRVLSSDHPERVKVTPDLADKDRRAIAAGDRDAIHAHNDSLAAARQALAGSNTTNGATQYRTRAGTDITTALGKDNKHPGTPVSMHFGPFTDVGRRRPVPSVIVVAP